MDNVERVKTGLSGLRAELGLKQEDVAKALGVSTRTVINWENGHHEPRLTVRQMKALCVLLQRPIERIPEDFSDLSKHQNAGHGSNMPGAQAY